MRPPKQLHPALTLLWAASLSVFALPAVSQSTPSPANKTASSSKPGAAHKSKVSRKSRRRERGQKAPTPQRISEIQQALAKDGSFTGSPNGKWDASTVDAMRRFQDAHGLNPSGKLDAKTLHLLGLGSPTAGLAPPLPPVSSSSTVASSGRTNPRHQ